MAQLFRYPLTLGSGEREGNQHIITFIAMKYNEKPDLCKKMLDFMC